MAWDINQIVVDTREQRPYWTAEDGVVQATLGTGDYSVVGHTGVVAIERKSVSDLYSSLGGKKGCRRKRLEQEFIRLGAMPWGAVVVEGTEKSCRRKFFKQEISFGRKKYAIRFWIGGVMGNYKDRYEVDI
jgi:ERCC4-type nuclease